MKYTPTPLASSYGSVAAINTNLTAIATALEKTLSRDGTSPNSMSADLDMNGNDIHNVGSISLAGGVAFLDTDDLVNINATIVAGDVADRVYTDAVVANAVASLALDIVEGDVQFARYSYTASVATYVVNTPYTGFVSSDVYLNGVHQDPVLGDYTVAGNVFTFTQQLEIGDTAYFIIGWQMTATGSYTLNTEVFTATEGQTVFNIATAPLVNGQAFVYVNGLKQQPSSYVVNGLSVTLDTGVALNDVVEVGTSNALQQAVTAANPVLLMPITISSNTLIPPGYNGLSVDPTIALNIVVTTSTGSVWAIVGE